MSKLSQALNKEHRLNLNAGFVQRLTNLVFPSFSEASYVLLLSILIYLVLLNNEARQFAINLFSPPLFAQIKTDPGIVLGFAFIIIILGSVFMPGILMLSKHEFSQKAKVSICYFYYIILGFLAFYATSNQSVSGSGLLYLINDWLLKLYVLISIIRFTGIVLVTKMDNDKANKLLTSQFSEEQIPPVDFLVLLVASYITVFMIIKNYNDPATIILLSFFYSSVAYKLYRLIFRATR